MVAPHVFLVLERVLVDPVGVVEPHVVLERRTAAANTGTRRNKRQGEGQRNNTIVSEREQTQGYFMQFRHREGHFRLLNMSGTVPCGNLECLVRARC